MAAAGVEGGFWGVAVAWAAGGFRGVAEAKEGGGVGWGGLRAVFGGGLDCGREGGRGKQEGGRERRGERGGERGGESREGEMGVVIMFESSSLCTHVYTWLLVLEVSIDLTWSC